MLATAGWITGNVCSLEGVEIYVHGHSLSSVRVLQPHTLPSIKLLLYNYSWHTGYNLQLTPLSLSQ